MKNHRLVVVGAGIAGLTAAHRLKRAGYDPIVFERAEKVGGRMATDVVEDFTIDYGAQFLYDNFSLLPNLIREVGLAPKLVQGGQTLSMLKGGQCRAFRADDLLSPLKSGILGLGAWLRFGVLGYGRLATQTKSLPANDITAWTQYDDLDGDAWSRSTFGREVADYVIEPQSNVFYFQHPREMSRVVPLVTSSLMYFKRGKYSTLVGGIDVLPRRLAAELDVRLDSPVRSLSIAASGIEVETDRETVIADRVLLAATAPVSCALYREPSPIERELLATSYSSTLVVAFATQDSYRVSPEHGALNGILMPEKERSPLVAITNERTKERTRVGNGELFLAFFSATEASKRLDQPDEEIVAVALRETEKYLPGLSAHLRFTKVYRWREAVARTPVGRARNVAQYRSGVNRSTKVFLAGDYMGLPYTDGAAETGQWAAAALLKTLT